MIDLQIARPIPIPLRFVVKHVSKMRSAFFVSIPGPASSMVTIMSKPFCLRASCRVCARPAKCCAFGEQRRKALELLAPAVREESKWKSSLSRRFRMASRRCLLRRQNDAIGTERLTHQTAETAAIGGIADLSPTLGNRRESGERRVPALVRRGDERLLHRPPRQRPSRAACFRLFGSKPDPLTVEMTMRC
jgi:hypothetical protein